MAIQVTADFLENEDGELLLAFKTLDGEPAEKTTLKFDAAGKSAVLARAAGQDVAIENIHNSVCNKLGTLSRVMITEVGPEGIERGYYADIV